MTNQEIQNKIETLKIAKKNEDFLVKNYKEYYEQHLVTSESLETTIKMLEEDLRKE